MTATAASKVRELVVVGAGPAGLAAGLAAARRGVAVTVIDGAPAAGGQLWRQSAVAVGRQTRPRPLEEALAHPGIEFLSSAQVVLASSHPLSSANGKGHLRLLVRDDSGVHNVEARALVLACGASELSLPFPGWDLPGVVTPGAAQALLKAQGVTIGRTAVVAGTGPFLWPVAAALLGAGVRLAAVVEAQPLSRALRSTSGLAASPALAAQAAGYFRRIAAARVPVLGGRAVVAAAGRNHLESVTLARLGPAGEPLPEGRRELTVDAACVGWGFVPAVELARSLGCREAAHPSRPHTVVVVDQRQATSAPGVFAAGEITGIGGGVLASSEGEIAGLSAANYLRDDVPDIQPTGSRRQPRAARRLRRARRGAEVLDRAFPLPAGWPQWLSANTISCRCEEVSWREVTDVLDAGIVDVRGVKGQTRCGMGWCQGRICGPALQSAVALRTSQPVSAVGDLSGRTFAAPLTVGELADLD